MKTKIKRHSRSVISVLLAVCMLFSCVMVATNAAIVADSGAVATKVDSESVGGSWDATGKNNLRISFDNMTTWSTFNSNSDGYINFTVPYDCTAYWEYWADYSGSKKYLKKSDSTPSSNDVTSTEYWARYVSADNIGTTYEFSADLKAGEYVIKYDSFANYGNTAGGSLKYYWYRKEAKAYGDITGGWSNYNAMTYDSTASAYYYEFEGNGSNKYFRTQRGDNGTYKSYQPYNGNFDLVNGTNGPYDGDTAKYGAQEGTSNSFYIPTVSGHTYRAWFSTDWGSTNKVWYTHNEPATPTDNYYVAGAYAADGTPGFFGTAWAENLSTNKMTYNSSTRKYEITYNSGVTGGSILFKVVKNGDWDEGSYPAENQSYKIQSDSTWVKFVFDPSTEEITVTQDGTGSSGDSGEWIAGDKYTSTGAAAGSNQHVSDTPSIGTTSSSYKYVWASNDDGPGKDGTKTPISLVENGASPNGYWAEITEEAQENSNLYFALSDNSSNSGIKGNKQEKINTVQKAAGNTVDMYNSKGNKVMIAEMKERSTVSGNAHFILLRNVDWSKVSAIGVMAYYSGSGAVDYQFYFKDKAATPVAEAKLVDIYAKDACLRDDTFNRFAGLADTVIDQTYFEYSETNASTGEVTPYTSISDYNTAHSDKKITYTTYSTAYGTNGNGAGYVKMTNVPVGAKIKIKTTLSSSSSTTGSFNSTAFKDTHYMKAYSFNGVTYQVNEWESDGVYEEIWTVRAINTQHTNNDGILTNATKEGKAVEVTPIYYMKDNTNTKTFYIDGYDGEVQNSWGNMLCVYPYYENKSNSANAFGGYPGQPMLLWGGKYQMEIPLTVDGTSTGATVKGLTLHNGFWDLLHRSLDIRCNDRNHAQTYDYDDFYKLYKEKNPDTIIFDFKYRTQEDHYSDGYDYTNYTFAGTDAKGANDFVGDNKNGVEIVTDYFGRQVDAFGTLITDSNKSDYDSTHSQDKELLFVSTGYKDTYVGEYATLWAVYAPQSSIPSGSGDTAGKFIGYISSSMLYLNNWDRRLQYTGGDSTDNGRMSWSQFDATYDHLKTYYKGVPALISYEKEIWNDSKDKANRSDGKWYYSNKSDKIQANIKIQYGSYTLIEAPDHSVSSDAWRDDPFDTVKTGVGGEKNIGKNTGCSAYFTNTSPNLNGKVNSGEQFADSTKKFTFEAVPSGAYMFAGWVRYSNGKYYEITEKEIGESPMSSNDTYIARFVEAQTGTLTVQHVVEQTDVYTGTGTPAVTVTVKNGSTTVETFTNSTVGEKLDISKYIDSHFASYEIYITLTTTPTNESYMKEIVSNSGNYAALPNSWTGNTQTGVTTATVNKFSVENILNSGVSSLRYVSHLQKPTYTYQYEITYHYNSRFWGPQSYKVTGTFASDTDFAANTTGNKTTAKLNTDFIIDKTPYEKNFRQQINWNYTDSAVASAGGTNDHGAAAMVNNNATLVTGTTYKMTADVYASNTVNDKVRAEFILPYNHTSKAEGATIIKGNLYYDDVDDSSHLESTTNIYDTSYESVTLETQAYKLFTYAGDPVTGGDNVHASELNLIEAAPYVIKNANPHHHYTTKDRYFSSGDDKFPGYQSFMIGNTKYWLNQKPDGESGTVVTSSTTATFNGTQYSYAILVNGTDSDPHNDELYRFVNVGQENVQYLWTSWISSVDGIVHDDSGVKKFFSYWEISNTKGEYVASCYNRRFNYSGYDNYVVRPIYESDTEQNYASSAGLDNSTLANITYLGDTRNQWKGDSSAQGDYQRVTGKTDGSTGGDKLIHDFALAYAYNGQEIQLVPNSTNGGQDIKIGMVIEKLGALDSVGSSKIVDSAYYADKYKDDINSTYIDKIKAALVAGGTSAQLRSATGKTSINSKIGANVDNWGTKFGTSTTTALSFDSVIDNFNRLQWFYTFTNTKDAQGNIGATNNANFAYRAWAYIIVDNAATVSSTPAYFTLYDSASR